MLEATLGEARGGSLASLRLGGVELLYRDPAPAPGAWAGGAPWLFPAVGRTRGGAMPIHGFAPESAWQKLGPLSCVLKDDARSRALYPFGFELRADYQTEGPGLRARLSVRAAQDNAGEMPFSVGNHLTLAFPAAACRLRADAARLLGLSPEGFLDGRSRPAALENGAAVAERPDLRDAVLGGFEGEPRLRVEPAGGPALELRQRAAGCDPGFFRFVLWTGAEGRFYCVEPWYGEPDSLNTGRGLVRLAPGARFDWEWELLPL